VTSPIRVVIVDDDVPTRVGISTILSSDPDIKVIGEADNGLDACTMAAELAPDLMVVDVQAALGLLRARPAPVAAASRLGAGCAADRLIALVVQRVIRQLPLGDAAPQVPVAPVGERVVLPEAAALVAFDQFRRGAGGALLAADTRDPAVRVRKRPLERSDLGDRAAVLGAAPGFFF